MRARCGQCGHILTVADPAAGEVPCPRCGHVLPAAVLGGVGEPPGGVVVRFRPDADEGYAREAERLMARQIRFVCSQCGRGLLVQTRFAGQRIRCPNCGAMIRIPYPDEEAEFDLAPIASDAEKLDVVDASEAELAETSAPVRPGDSLWPPAGTRRRGARRARGASRASRQAAAAGHRRAGRDSRALWLAGIAVVVVLWLGGLAYVIVQGTGDGGNPTEGSVGGTPAAAGGANPSDGTAEKPDPSGDEVPAPHEPAPQPEPVEPPADGEAQPAGQDRGEIAVTAAGFDVFAAGNYAPAGPGRVYLRLTVRLQAGAEALRFDSAGTDVVFRSNGGRYASLGLATAAPALGQRGRRERIVLPPGRQRELTFLFEVPARTAAGAVRVKGLPAASVGTLFPPEPAAAAALVGAYDEVWPRYLKPLLDGPVCRALQQARGGGLIVARRPNGLHVLLPQAEVSGAIDGGAGGLYAALLRRGEDVLRVRLRPAAGGRRLVLYLRDEPHHQIVYRKRTAGGE